MHVVVDGSNIATEGRSAPSLAQLDEAVREFTAQRKVAHVIVVVDATFPNRIDRKERQAFEDAVNAGEVLSPPAGAIGRGDAFILEIAERANASILSNDSFQEFHGKHKWLFDEGRLIGGKPVPGVGWIFMERMPVRGATSRKAVSAARKGEDSVAAATRRTRRSSRKASAPMPVPTGPPPQAKKASKAAKAEKATDKTADKAKADKAAKAERAPKAEKATKATKAAKAERVQKADKAQLAAGNEATTTSRRRRSRGRTDATAINPYNEPLPFLEFVAAHPPGSEVEGTVDRFSSHGAYVAIGNVQAYIPLRNMGDPPPRSARSVLRIGDSRPFLVQAIDAPRRGIDLGLTDVVSATEPMASADAASHPVSTEQEERLAPVKKAAKKRAPAKKAAKRRAPAKKAAKKRAPARKAAKKTTKKATKKRAPAKKAAKKRAPAKKAAKRRPAKKAAKKATKKRAPAKKAAKKRAPAKKAAKKRAPAKKAAKKRAPAKKARKATKKRR